MGVVRQDLGAFTTVRASEFWICWRWDNWDLWVYSRQNYSNQVWSEQQT